MFTWGESLIGGLFAGTATTSVWYLNSMVAGHSNMFGHVFRGDVENKHLFARRILFMAGLVVAGILMAAALPLRDITMEPVLPIAWWQYVVAGLLIGFGTQIAGGCTLGGLPFGSTRSILSFLTFFVTAIVINNWVHGGWRFLSEGGSMAVTDAVTIPGRDVGMLAGVYAILVGLLAVSAVIKRKVNSLLGSLLVMFVAAVMFGIGFGLGGMLQQSKVLGSMDVSVRWDPSVWVFCAASLLFTTIGVQMVRRLGFFSNDEPPESVAVTDFWLVIGAAMVGISFGMVGLTVGSAMTMLPRIFEAKESLSRLLLFFASAAVGIWTHYGLSKAAVKKADPFVGDIDAGRHRATVPQNA